MVFLWDVLKCWDFAVLDFSNRATTPPCMVKTTPERKESNPQNQDGGWGYTELDP